MKIIDRETVDRRKPRLAPRLERTASVDQSGIDDDDLLALLDRPRPAHGDLQTLLSRRSVTRGEDEETFVEGRSAELTRDGRISLRQHDQ